MCAGPVGDNVRTSGKYASLALFDEEVAAVGVERVGGMGVTIDIDFGAPRFRLCSGTAEKSRSNGG